jgi:hypothetical protein
MGEPNNSPPWGKPRRAGHFPMPVGARQVTAPVNLRVPCSSRYLAPHESDCEIDFSVDILKALNHEGTLGHLRGSAPGHFSVAIRDAGDAASVERLPVPGCQIADPPQLPEAKTTGPAGGGVFPSRTTSAGLAPAPEPRQEDQHRKGSDDPCGVLCPAAVRLLTHDGAARYPGRPQSLARSSRAGLTSKKSTSNRLLGLQGTCNFLGQSAAIAMMHFGNEASRSNTDIQVGAPPHPCRWEPNGLDATPPWELVHRGLERSGKANQPNASAQQPCLAPVTSGAASATDAAPVVVGDPDVDPKGPRSGICSESQSRP